MTEKNKEQAILEAAEQEFLEKGFENSKTTKIAAIAGVTHAMLHYYYRTKENLFDMVFDKKINLLKDSLFASYNNSNASLLEKIQKGMEAHFDFLKKNPQLPRFVLEELISKPKRLILIEKKIKHIATPVFQELEKEIDAEVKNGTINPIEPYTLLLDIVSINVFVFAALPVIRTFMINSKEDEEKFLEARKKENIEIIMRRLKK